jgi:hypothetical protein
MVDRKVMGSGVMTSVLICSDAEAVVVTVWVLTETEVPSIVETNVVV